MRSSRQLWFGFGFALVVGSLVMIARGGADPSASAVKAVGVLAAQKVRGDADEHVVTADDGTKIRLQDRERMRLKDANAFVVPPEWKVAVRKGAANAAPVAPAVFDLTRGNTIAFPTLGNDQVGDCYYTAILHGVQTWGGMRGKPVEFSTAAVIARYRKLSGGDNGLSDSDIYGNSHNGEWYGGVIGPNGPHKILDHLVVKATDPDAIALAQWLYGGTIYTAALCNEWVHAPKPGQIWDKGRSNPGYGHAMYLNGRNAKGHWTLQTWGFNPPIELTQAGLESSDPEIVVQFSLEWFDPTTGRAPNGLHYVELADLWKGFGGRQLPPNPFPAPGPPVPPNPPVPPIPGANWSGTIVIVNGQIVSITPGTGAGGIEADLTAAGVSVAAAQAAGELFATVRARAPVPEVCAKVLKLIEALYAEKAARRED